MMILYQMAPHTPAARQQFLAAYPDDAELWRRIHVDHLVDDGAGGDGQDVGGPGARRQTTQIRGLDGGAVGHGIGERHALISTGPPLIEIVSQVHVRNDLKSVLFIHRR